MKGEKKKDETTLASYLAAYQQRIHRPDELYHSESQEHLPEYDNLYSYLAGKGKNHREYKHYATRERIASIIDGGALYLTDGATWNDKYDRDHFNPSYSPYKRFGACFSVSRVESVAMWMLYGGMDGNGAMINFDRNTLVESMKAGCYEFGRFNKNGEFECIIKLSLNKMRLDLVDVLYFQSDGGDVFDIGRSSLGSRSKLDRIALEGIEQIAKHSSWSYENEVRLVAKVDTADLGRRASHIKCVKIPLKFEEGFLEGRVFDSPTADDHGFYCDSELCGTVDWNLCAGCAQLKR